MDNPYQPPSTPVDGPEGGYYSSLAPQRPAALTVLGILSIIFGSLGLICTPFSALFLFIFIPGADANPALAIMKDPIYRSVLVGMTVAGAIAAAVELAGGIGLLRLRTWGRNLSIAYALYAIAAIIVGLTFNLTYVMPRMNNAIGKADPQAAAGAFGGMIGGTLGSILGLIYPIVLLAFMFHPSTVKALLRKPKEEEELPTLEPL